MLLMTSLLDWSNSGVENEAISVGMLHLLPKTIWYGEIPKSAWGVLFRASTTVGRCWSHVPGADVIVCHSIPIRMPFLLSTVPWVRGAYALDVTFWVFSKFIKLSTRVDVNPEALSDWIMRGVPKIVTKL